MVVVRARSAYEVARQHRAELRQAIESFAQAVASPAGEQAGEQTGEQAGEQAGERAWQEGALRQLVGLREQVVEHMVVTEGSDGLYAELLEYAPRLARPVAGLAAEHVALLTDVDALAHQLREPAGELEPVRTAADELLVALSRHRQRGADLVYEAYATDIGGET